MNIGTQRDTQITWHQLISKEWFEFDTRVENKKAVVFFFKNRIVGVIIKVNDEETGCTQNGISVTLLRNQDTHESRMEALFANQPVLLYDHSEFSHNRQLLLHYAQDTVMGFDLFSL